MDVTQALKDAENALRDFIAVMLERKHGSDWLSKAGISEEKVKKWQERKEEEEKRLGTVVDERLLYYAEFHDLAPLLKRNWIEFTEALGECKVMEVFLGILGNYRNPDAHRRELLTHEKHLILGISGEIRARIVRYRSNQETSEDYYPRIESARDSLGSVYTAGDMKFVWSGRRLNVGDVLEFSVTATDPMEEALEFRWTASAGARQRWQGSWMGSHECSLPVLIEQIGRDFEVRVEIRSGREFHAGGDVDDSVKFFYEVLPVRR